MLVREALLLVNSDMQHDPETAIWEPQTDNEWQTTLDLWNMGSNTNGKNLMNQFFKTLIDFFFSVLVMEVQQLTEFSANLSFEGDYAIRIYFLSLTEHAFISTYVY